MEEDYGFKSCHSTCSTEKFFVDDQFAETFCKHAHDIKFKLTRACPMTISSGHDESPPKFLHCVTTRIVHDEDLEVVNNEATRIQVYQIGRKNSYSRIGVTRELFESFCHTNKVSSSLWNFIRPFGFQSRMSELGQAACTFQTVKSRGSVISYECMYSFFYVERNGRESSMQESNNYDAWSVRQTAVYQSYNTIDDQMKILLVAPSADVQSCVEDEMMHQEKQQDQLTPFNFHCLILSTMHENWTQYLRDLGNDLKRQTEKLALAQVGNGNNYSTELSTQSITFLDRQKLNIVSDRVLDLITIFESLSHSISRLITHCRNRLGNDRVGDIKCITVLDDLNSLKEDVQLNLRKSQILHNRIESTAKLITNFLEFENATTAHSHGKSLNMLTSEARNESFKMMALAERSTRDAAAVRILTIITLIYLPVTVVASFFSSQLVHVDDRGQVSVVAGAWWFAVVAIPLTLITFTLWRFWLNYSLSQRESKIRAASLPHPVIAKRDRGVGGIRWFIQPPMKMFNALGRNGKREKT